MSCTFSPAGCSRSNSICIHQNHTKNIHARPRRADVSGCDRERSGGSSARPWPTLSAVLGCFCDGLSARLCLFTEGEALGDLSESLNIIRHAHAPASSGTNTNADTLLTPMHSKHTRERLQLSKQAQRTLYSDKEK